jgi:thiol-disulfide isomerase/thioredoxin
MKTIKLLALAALTGLAGRRHANSAEPRHLSRSLAGQSRHCRRSQTAAATHKRILLDFGGNWCGDCQVLDLYFHDPGNRPILEANFVLVHVNIGHMDANLDLAARYQVPLNKGVPALAVLSEKGKLLYSQKGGEFEAMRRMESSSVTQFLVQWKPVQPGCSTARKLRTFREFERTQLHCNGELLSRSARLS